MKHLTLLLIMSLAACVDEAKVQKRQAAKELTFYRNCEDGETYNFTDWQSQRCIAHLLARKK